MLENYKLLPYLFIRTPLLPVNILTSLESIDLKLEINYKSLKVQEAIYLASPDLYYLLIKWLKDSKVFSGSDEQKIKESLLKYLTRMCTRCTPFGMFAGYNLCEWDKSTSLIIDHTDYKRSIRFDMMLMSYMANLLSKNEIIKHQLRYFPNSSLHEHAGNYRYFETISTSSDMRYHLSEIDKNPYITRLFRLATNGRKIDDLCKMITDNEVNPEDAENLISDLIENQILVNELEPVISGKPYLDVLLSFLNQIKVELGELPEEAKTVYNIINEANTFFQLKSNNNSTTNIINYKKIFKQIKVLIPDVNQKFIFQVDLVTKYKSNSVCNKLAGQIRQATEVLHSIFPPRKNNRLSTFKQEFYNRFEHEEVSLLQVLDNESGLGYPVFDEDADLVPIIDDVAINNTKNSIYPTEVTINRWLQNKYLTAIKEGQIEVNITDNELKELSDNNQMGNFPDTISVMGSIIKTKDDQLEKILLKGTVLSASSLLGRFTHSDPEIDKYVKYITLHEQQLNKSKILAEIVHLPQSRIGNVIIRSHLRDYEIPFLAKSTLPKNKVIKISDLTISVSEGQEKIILKSKKLNREILPRLSSAHNFDNTNQLPLYRFLCDLQNQNYINPINFSWQQTGLFYPIKPRVVYKNVILYRAGWVFESKELTSLKTSIINGDFDEIRKWREKWQIPSKVVLVEGDNELFLDLENQAFLSLLARKIVKPHVIELFEFLFESDNCVVKDKQGGFYTNEFIMTFAKEIINPKTDVKPDKIEALQKVDKTKRLFPIGSNWIYFKVYLGFKTSDEIIYNFRKLINKYKRKGIILQWFFIRYYDPKYHLRIRILIQHEDYIGEILSEVFKTFNPKIKSGQINNIQLDTYRREIERYGADVIEVVEKYFELQSIIIVDFLKITINDSEQDLLKFIFAIKLVDILLIDFGFNLEDKKMFVYNSLCSFEKEFHINGISKKQITKKYLFLEPVINSIFEDTSVELNNWHLIYGLITKYSKSRIKLTNEMKRESSLLRNANSRDSFIWSLNHMFINKLVRTKSRKFEYIVYAILDKHLKKLYHKTSLN